MRILFSVSLVILGLISSGQSTFQKILNVDDGEDFPRSVQIVNDGYLICAGGFIDDLEWMDGYQAVQNRLIW